MAPSGTTTYWNDPITGAKAEHFTGSATTQWNDYIIAGGGIVAIYYERTPGPNLTRYLHKDHLGSTAVITDESGAVVERDGYDTWGKRRYPNGTDDDGALPTSATDKGYTGQEQLEEVALVHMNGRIYDPQVGRFMSADPYIQDALNTQDYNRYAYVTDNPLAFTDPSGYFSLGHIFHSIFHSSIGRAVIAIAAAATAQYYALPALEGTTFTALQAADSSLLAVNAGISGGLAGAITTGNMKGIVIGVITAEGFYQAGSIGTSGDLANVAAHAAVGCASAALNGANCGTGAAAAGVADFAGARVGSDWKIVASTVKYAVIGGTTSVMFGGKFANGATTGAFGYLFNDLAHAWAGTQATYALADQLNLRDGAGTWMVNRKSFWDVLLNGYADLIYQNGETYEIKTNGCLAQEACLAAAHGQLGDYIRDSQGRLQIGTDFTAFRGAPGRFGYGRVWSVDVSYWFRPSGTPGLIGYDIDGRSSTISAIWSAARQRKGTSFGGTLPFASPNLAVP